ncbi:MAG TPA: hypothetical protein VJZ69_02135 [Clostridia bacterium]|nr:hypothetical protein [Clostridia bacterium]
MKKKVRIVFLVLMILGLISSAISFSTFSDADIDFSSEIVVVASSAISFSDVDFCS